MKTEKSMVHLAAVVTVLLVTVTPLATPAETMETAVFPCEQSTEIERYTTISELRKHAAQGHAAAQFYLGVAHERGRMALLDNDSKAVMWYRLAAGKGYTAAQYALGKIYTRWNMPAEAAWWFRMAAEQGCAVAQVVLGFMYHIGRGVPKNDSEAILWYELAAEQRHSDALYILGLVYAGIWNELIDPGLGYTEAQLFDGSERGPDEDAKAVQAFREAAKLGHAGAQYYLGLMHQQGKGIPENIVKAYAWASAAAEQGHAEGKKLKESLTERMTQAQIAEAQKLSREYWARYVVPFQ